MDISVPICMNLYWFQAYVFKFDARASWTRISLPSGDRQQWTGCRQTHHHGHWPLWYWSVKWTEVPFCVRAALRSKYHTRCDTSLFVYIMWGVCPQLNACGWRAPWTYKPSCLFQGRFIPLLCYDWQCCARISADSVLNATHLANSLSPGATWCNAARKFGNAISHTCQASVE